MKKKNPNQPLKKQRSLQLAINGKFKNDGLFKFLNDFLK